MRHIVLLALLSSFGVSSCAATTTGRGSEGGAQRSAMDFIESRLRPFPIGRPAGEIVVTETESGRIAVYDSALAVLVALRNGKRERAGRILHGLASLQGEDGALPFSFVLPGPEMDRLFVRSGAIAWVGYAAVEYLDSGRGDSGRERVVALAHRAAHYLLEHQVTAEGDPRDGLVRGGSGTLRYTIKNGAPFEIYIEGELPWTAIEHNIDSYFFLRDFARVTENQTYAVAAKRIGKALVERGWNSAKGQFFSGMGEKGADDSLSLDCASWGSLVYEALGEKAKAETAAAVADGRYASHDTRSRALGHIPYIAGPVLDDRALMDHFEGKLAVPTWDRALAVWPEGSAGVALAALRHGRVERARAILDALEPLRSADGSLPTFTMSIPFSFDTRPSVAGTAWVELVRFELRRPPDRPVLFRP